MNRRESPTGYHFQSTFDRCHREHMFLYLYGLRPRVKPPALVFGSAIHEAEATLYRGGLQEALAVFGSMMETDTRSEELV
jgi:hypothetical protein